MHLKWCIIYLDDIIVFSKTPKEHIERLRGVFKKLSTAGLRLNLRKCEFFKSRITYLGHTVSKDGIETENKKVSTIQEWPIPKPVTEVGSSLGSTNFYHKFILKYAQIAGTINQLVSGENVNRKKALVEWNEECQEAVNKLKQLLSQGPTLAMLIIRNPSNCIQMLVRMGGGLYYIRSRMMVQITL